MAGGGPAGGGPAPEPALRSEPESEPDPEPALPGTAGLLPLPGGALRVWDQVVVRGAGFGLHRLLETTDPVAAAGVDAAYAAFEAGISPTGGPNPARERLERAAAALVDHEHRALRRAAAQPDFQEAVFWQNTAVLAEAVLPLGRLPETARRNQSLRRKERAVARYLARYAAKNDTIGFTGPVCWASLAPDGPAVVVRTGPGLVARRQVYLEPWAVDLLAATLAADPGLRPLLLPRRNPSTAQVGEWLRRTDGPPLRLGPRQLALLAVLDATAGAADRPHGGVVGLAAGAVAARPELFADADAVVAVLAELVAVGALRWDAEPELREHPERQLRRTLLALPEAPPRAAALAALARLERGRDALAAARGVDELLAADAGLRATFTDLTAQAPYHGHGATYAGRQLSYLDSRRDAQVRLGAGLLERIGAPLSLLVTSLRGLASRVAHLYEEAFRTATAGVAWATGCDAVPVSAVMAACAPILTDPGQRLCDLAIADFVRGWEALLGLDRVDGAVESVALTSAQLLPGVRERFPVTTAPWVQARLHSADVQIGAASPADADHGQLVLGELHAYYAAAEAAVMVGQHPDPERLRRLMAASLPGPRMMLVPNKGHPRVLARTIPALHTAADYWLSLNDFPGGDPDRRGNLAELLVAPTDGTLVAATADGRIRMRLLDVLGMLLAGDLVDVMKLIGRDRPYLPRVTIDSLVVLRRSWGVPVAELLAQLGRDEVTTFARLRRWAAGTGLPRWVFASVPGESKPFLVDFASVVQLAVFATTVRGAVRHRGVAGESLVRLQEMLPGPGQVWLPAPDGGRCTSELRFQLVDDGW